MHLSRSAPPAPPRCRPGTATPAHPHWQPPCAVDALAALGPLLCRYPVADVDPLGGWMQARHAVHVVHLDSDGPGEAIRFADAGGRCCWQLFLLPDSDYLEWSRLVGGLAPAAPVPHLPAARGSACAAIAHAIGQLSWRACPLRLYRVDPPPGGAWLAAAPARLSPAGQREAERLARARAPHWTPLPA